jgi:hypothetical protein
VPPPSHTPPRRQPGHTRRSMDTPRSLALSSISPPRPGSSPYRELADCITAIGGRREPRERLVRQHSWSSNDLRIRTQGQRSHGAPRGRDRPEVVPDRSTSTSAAAFPAFCFSDPSILDHAAAAESSCPRRSKLLLIESDDPTNTPAAVWDA